MTTLWQAPAIVIVITWLSAPPGTLGNAARQEALRRSLMPRSVIALSLYDWPPVVVGSESAGSTPPAARSAPDPAAAAALPASPLPAGAIPPAASSEPGRDQSWWRARIATARASLARDQTMAEAMQSHVNALQNDVVNRDDPAQQALLRQRLATALGGARTAEGPDCRRSQNHPRHPGRSPSSGRASGVDSRRAYFFRPIALSAVLSSVVATSETIVVAPMP